MYSKVYFTFASAFASIFISLVLAEDQRRRGQSDQGIAASISERWADTLHRPRATDASHAQGVDVPSSGTSYVSTVSPVLRTEETQPSWNTEYKLVSTEDGMI